MTRPEWIETAKEIPPPDELCLIWYDCEIAAFDPDNERPWWIINSGQGSFEIRLALEEVPLWIPCPDPLWEDQQP